MKILLFTLLFVLAPVFRLCKEIESKSYSVEPNVPPLSSTRENAKDTPRRSARRNNEKTPIVFICYHKTGTELTAGLNRVLAANHVSRQGGKFKFKRENNSPDLKRAIHCTPASAAFFQDPPLGQSKVSVIGGPDFFCDGWSKTLPKNFKLVHFVRDPFEMALSSYLYHSQRPTPEPWVFHVKACSHNRKTLKVLAEKIKLSMDVVDPVIELCNSLMPMNDTNYYARLRSLSPEEGLRLETARFMISTQRSSGSDILRMAANMVELSRFGNKSRIKTYSLGNFTSDLHKKLNELLRFSFQESKDFSWIPVVTKSYEAIYQVKIHGNNKHITSNKLSSSEKRSMMEELKRDVILSPLLNRVQEVIQMYS